MGDNNTSLKVSIGELKNYGDYLVSSVSILNEKLDGLSKCMAKLDSSWTDVDGESYISKFSTFINDAKKINNEIDGLGKFATSMSGKYETILLNHLDRM